MGRGTICCKEGMLRKRRVWTPLQYIHVVQNVQQILVTAFDLTIAARRFKSNQCVSCGVKKVGQHCSRD